LPECFPHPDGWKEARKYQYAAPSFSVFNGQVLKTNEHMNADGLLRISFVAGCSSGEKGGKRFKIFQ
jgi:hypothetical protein